MVRINGTWVLCGSVAQLCNSNACFHFTLKWIVGQQGMVQDMVIAKMKLGFPCGH